MVHRFVGTVLFVAAIVLNSIWYEQLRRFNGHHAEVQSHHVKDIVLVSTLLYSVVAVLTAMRCSDFVHWLLSGRVGAGVVLAHVTLAAFFVSVAWFDGFIHLTQLNPLYKAHKFPALFDNLLPTFALVVAHLLSGVVACALFHGRSQERERMRDKRCKSSMDSAQVPYVVYTAV